MFGFGSCTARLACFRLATWYHLRKARRAASLRTLTNWALLWTSVLAIVGVDVLALLPAEEPARAAGVQITVSDKVLRFFRDYARKKWPLRGRSSILTRRASEGLSNLFRIIKVPSLARRVSVIEPAPDGDRFTEHRQQIVDGRPVRA